MNSDQRALDLQALIKTMAKIIPVDVQLKDRKDDTDTKLRKAWLAETIKELTGVSDSDSFNSKIKERLLLLKTECDVKELSSERKEFIRTVSDAFRLIQSLVNFHFTDKNDPMGPSTWHRLSQEYSIGSVKWLKGFVKERAYAKREAQWNKAGLSSEEGLFKQKNELMKRFGFSRISVEGLDVSAAAQSIRLEKIEKNLTQAALELGLKNEAQMGFCGEYGLTAIDDEVNDSMLGLCAYMSPDSKTLAIPSKVESVSYIKHEWSHMLDARLGELVKEQLNVKEESHPWMKKAKESMFFSSMPLEAQKVIPEAFEGYWEVTAAAQGFKSRHDLLNIKKEAEDKSEALINRVCYSLLSDPFVAFNLTLQQEAKLKDELTPALKTLLSSKAVEYKSRHINIEGESLRIGDVESYIGFKQEEVLLKNIAKILDHHLGESWRMVDNKVLDNLEAIKININKKIGRSEIDSIRELSFMIGGLESTISPQSSFAQASKILDLSLINKEVYLDTSHEMFARIIGRESNLAARVSSVGVAKLISKGLAINHSILENDARFVKLDKNAFNSVNAGFSKMGEASGVGSLNLQKGLIEKVEQAALDPKNQKIMNIAGKVTIGAAKIHYFVGVASVSTLTGFVFNSLRNECKKIQSLIHGSFLDAILTNCATIANVKKEMEADDSNAVTKNTNSSVVMKGSPAILSNLKEKLKIKRAESSRNPKSSVDSTKPKVCL